MRVLVIHNRYQISGGEDRVVQAELALLRGQGEEVSLYERDNAEFTRFSPADKARHLYALPFVRQAYEDIRSRLRAFHPDVVHVHNVFYMISPAVYTACREEGVPVVQTLHNFRLLCLNGLFFRDGHSCEDCQDQRSLWPGVARRCFRHSFAASAALARGITRHWHAGTWQKDVARYIALSSFSRDKFVLAGIPSEKIVVKGNFLPAVTDVGEGPRAGGYALFIGRLSREKGLDVLARAWRSLDLPLKIIGEGPEAAGLAARFSGCPVEYLGPRTPEECRQYLRGASCLVLPSLCYENCPRVVIEAYAGGIPVIASRVGSIPEMVTDGESGFLFCPGDARDLAGKVAHLIAGGVGLNETLRRGAVLAYQEHFTPDRHYQFLRGLYEEVAAGGPG